MFHARSKHLDRLDRTAPARILPLGPGNPLGVFALVRVRKSLELLPRLGELRRQLDPGGPAQLGLEADVEAAAVDGHGGPELRSVDAPANRRAGLAKGLFCVEWQLDQRPLARVPEPGAECLHGPCLSSLVVLLIA